MDDMINPVYRVSVTPSGNYAKKMDLHNMNDVEDLALLVADGSPIILVQDLSNLELNHGDWPEDEDDVELV